MFHIRALTNINIYVANAHP